MNGVILKISMDYTYTHHPWKPIIALSNSLHTNERRLRSVLSHELGHHFETVGHHMIAASGPGAVYRTKNEMLATKWAVNFMIDTYTFLKCVGDGMDKQQLADYFYVLPAFVTVKGRLLEGTEDCLDVIAELKTSYNVYF